MLLLLLLSPSSAAHQIRATLRDIECPPVINVNALNGLVMDFSDAKVVKSQFTAARISGSRPTRVWNSLPSRVASLSSNGFKRHLKTELFTRCFIYVTVKF